MAYVPTKEQRLVNHERRLELANRTLDVLRDIGFTDRELCQMITNSESAFKDLVERGKIRAVCLKSTESKSERP